MNGKFYISENNTNIKDEYVDDAENVKPIVSEWREQESGHSVSDEAICSDTRNSTTEDEESDEEDGDEVAHRFRTSLLNGEIRQYAGN